MSDPPVDSRDALWASDRTRVAVCVRVVPVPGVTYEGLRDEVFTKVEWGDRNLRWHESRKATDADSPSGWSMECTASCLAHGDEQLVVHRIEACACDVVHEADLLVSAPCHLPLLTVTATDLAFDAESGLAIGGAEPKIHDTEKNEKTETAAHIVRSAGVALARTALPRKEIDRAMAAVTRRISLAEHALARNHPDIKVGQDVFAFKEMGSRGGNRFDLLFPKFVGDETLEDDDDDAGAAGTLVDDAQKLESHEQDSTDDDTETRDTEFIHRLARTAPWVRSVVNPLLETDDSRRDETRGDDDDDDDDASKAFAKNNPNASPNSWWCEVSVVYSKPGCGNQDWHCDGRHIAGASQSDFGGKGTSPPYAICVFVPLIDLTQQTGFTQFWPGSHRVDGLIGFGAAVEVLRGSVDGLVDAGGCVVYDYRCMHRGMGNFTENTTRPVLQFLYAKGNYRETKNYGARSLFIKG